MGDLAIYVRLGDKAVLLQLSRSSTVGNLKEAIATKEGIPPDDQLIVLRGKVLGNHDVLISLDSFENSIVQCFDKAPQREESACSVDLQQSKVSVKITVGRVSLKPDSKLTLVRFPDELAFQPVYMSFKARDLVYHIKLSIENTYRLLVKDQSLRIGSTELHNGRRLSFYEGITQPSTGRAQIYLTYKGPIPDSKDDIFVQVLVKTLTGKTITINNANLSDPVFFLKRQIEDKEGTPTDSQRLIFEGKQLQDERTLTDYKVTAGSTMHLVVRLKGGQGISYLWRAE